MSHVVGQGTIASNHYRTPQYRASQYQSQPVAQPVEQFNAEKSEWGATVRRTQVKRAIKGLTDLLPDLRKQLDDGLINDSSIKKMLDSTDEDLIQRMKNIFDNPDVDANDMVWLRKMMKGETLDGADTRRMSQSLRGSKSNPIKAVDVDATDLKRASDDIADAIDDAPMSDTRKTIAKYTAVGTTFVASVAVLMGMGGSDLLRKWANYTTGLDCDEKAADRGFEEGSDEYAEAVKSCQQGSIDALLRLGYGALAIIGFVGVVAVTRAIPKRKAKKEEPEEEEDAPEDEE
jgi:hypothetical protein